MTLEIVSHEAVATLERPMASVVLDNLAIDKERASWSHESWLRYPNYQPLSYSLTDESLIREQVMPELKAYPPLVIEPDITTLARHLKAMTLNQPSLRHSFVLQGGYCAESFDDACPQIINSIIATLQECAEILFPTRSHTCLLLPRIAGQVSLALFLYQRYMTWHDMTCHDVHRLLDSMASPGPNL